MMAIEGNKITGSTSSGGTFCGEEPLTIQSIKAGCFIRQRYVLAILLWLGAISVSLQRNSPSVGILDMVNNATVTNGSLSQEHFEWDIKQETLFLGAYMYGYAPSNLSGSFLARKYGLKLVYGLSVLLSSIVHLMTPYLIILNFGLGIACRVMIGVLHGVIGATAAEAWVHWAPRLETSTLSTIAMSGISFGAAVSYSIIAYMTQNFGWKCNFYVSGWFGVCWFIPFYLITSNTPSENRWITKQELKYITENTTKRNSKKAHSIPLKKILASMPVLAIFAIHFCDNLSMFTQMALLPTYVFYIYGFSITESGLLIALPFALTFITGTISAKVTDFLRSRRILETITARRINTVVGSVCLAVLMLISAYSSDLILAMVLITISISMTGVSMSGYLVNAIDIAPQFNAIIFGISNGLAALPGFIGPQLAGSIISEKTSVEQWRTWFWIAAGINMSGLLFYLIFSSSTKLKWAEKYEEEKEDKDNNNECKTFVVKTEDE